MKSLYLIRHAKSSWENETLHDFDRPLNARGKRDAPHMGKWLKQQGEIPDLVISSPAKRARKTAEKIAKETGYPEKEIVFEPQLYESTVPVWLQHACALPNNKNRIFMVGHNNTITEFVNYITGACIANIPTCGVVKVTFFSDNWQEISRNTGDLQWFQYPKNLSGIK